MKRTKLVLGLLMIGFLNACNSQVAEEEAQARYSCPMQCEGDKQHEEAGKCPVCGMDLEEVAMVEEEMAH